MAPVRSARGRPSPHHDEISLPLAQEANCLKKDSPNTLFESVSTARIQLLHSCVFGTYMRHKFTITLPLIGVFHFSDRIARGES